MYTQENQMYVYKKKINFVYVYIVYTIFSWPIQQCFLAYLTNKTDL